MVRKQLKATRKLQLKRFKVRAKAFQEAWPRIKDSRRVVIHIPSLGYAQHIRDELSEIKILQNLQMARLCDIADLKRLRQLENGTTHPYPQTFNAFPRRNLILQR